MAFAQAHAQGVAYAAPAWPTQVVANAEVSQAVALGVDLAGDGSGESSSGTSTGGATGTGPSAGGGSGGGAMAPAELPGLLACAALPGARRPKRARDSER